MKNKIQFKQHFATTFRPLTKKNMILVYQSTILVHFTMLAPKAVAGTTDTYWGLSKSEGNCRCRGCVNKPNMMISW